MAGEVEGNITCTIAGVLVGGIGVGKFDSSTKVVAVAGGGNGAGGSGSGSSLLARKGRVQASTMIVLIERIKAVLFLCFMRCSFW